MTILWDQWQPYVTTGNIMWPMKTLLDQWKHYWTNGNIETNDLIMWKRTTLFNQWQHHVTNDNIMGPMTTLLTTFYSQLQPFGTYFCEQWQHFVNNNNNMGTFTGWRNQCNLYGTNDNIMERMHYYNYDKGLEAMTSFRKQWQYYRDQWQHHRSNDTLWVHWQRYLTNDNTLWTMTKLWDLWQHYGTNKCQHYGTNHNIIWPMTA